MAGRIREVKINRGGDGYGGYYQLVESKRVDVGEGKKQPRTIVLMHLGEHATVEEALEAWPREIDTLRSAGRPNQAEKLQAKLSKLRELKREGE